MSFPFTKLSSTAVLTASKQILGTVEHLKIETEPRFSELLTAVESDTADLTNGINKNRKGELTEEIDVSNMRYIHDYDLFHDSAKIGARDTSIEVDGTIIPSSEAIAAEKIIEIMGVVKPMSRLTRTEQLGLFSSQKKIFETPELQQVITDAAILPKYSKLCISHTNLNNLMKESAKLEFEKNMIPCSSRAKMTLALSLNELCRFVDLFAKLKNPDYMLISGKIEELLSKYRPMVNHKQNSEEIHEDLAEELNEVFTVAEIGEEDCEEDHCIDHDTLE